MTANVPLDARGAGFAPLAGRVGPGADVDLDLGARGARLGQRHAGELAEGEQALDAGDHVVGPPDLAAGRLDPEVEASGVGHAVRLRGRLRLRHRLGGQAARRLWSLWAVG
jgi:hypothetical protein